MLSASPRVVPVDEEEIEFRPDIETNKNFEPPADAADDAPPPEEEMPQHATQSSEFDAAYVKFLLKQVAISRRYERFREVFNYDHFKELLKWFLDSATLSLTFSFEDITLWMTLFVLFADDIKILCSPVYTDVAFAVAYAICLFTFIFEFLATSWSKTLFMQFFPVPQWSGYFLTFFWWLDLIAILSLFPDIPFIANPLGIGHLFSDVSGGSNYTKAGRVVRLVRLVRLVKVYKVASERRRRQKQEDEMLELVRLGAISESKLEKQRGLYNQRQSRLGDQLSESTTRRVIILVLLILIVLPLLLNFPTNEGPDFAMKMLHKFNTAQDVSQEAKQTVLDVFVAQLSNNYSSRFVDYLEVTPLASRDPYIHFAGNLDSLRDNQKMNEAYSTTVGATTYVTSAVFSLQELSRSQAMYSILTTIFIAIIMVGGALTFAHDAEELVIAPIKRMMNMVEAVAADPLKPLHFDHSSKNDAGDYEMRLLETTVEKITGLLRVGFGEAGAGIISANLSSKDSSAAIDPLLPGVRIYAIFGFCDIHHFEDINRKLEKDVLVFVNQIAEIVHSSVHAWSGQCNKNLGNAFVIVWRIGDEHKLAALQQGNRLRGGSGAGSNVGAHASTGSGSFGHGETASVKLLGSPTFGSTKILPPIEKRNSSTPAPAAPSTFTKPAIRKVNSSSSSSTLDSADFDEGPKKRVNHIDLRRVPGVDILADQALIGYCKIIAEINRNKYVMRYRTEPRLTDKGKHDFKVRMGFGLHAGWAIEGAVGSLQKVDATYLSPHVNMAARLETSSKQYGVPLLASQDFYDLLSNEGQRVMRRLDVVTVKGSEVPIGIYTYDALQDQPFMMDGRRQRPSQQTGSNLVLMNAAFAAVSSRNNNNGNSNAGSSKASPSGSGTSTPNRRPSITLLPGTEKPAMFLTPEDHTGDVFEQDYDMLTLRKHAVDPEFQGLFKEGVGLYLGGDWKGAKVLLERADLYMREAAPTLGGDGPSCTLLDYMGNQNFEAPKSWKGFRPLTSK